MTSKAKIGELPANATDTGMRTYLTEKLSVLLDNYVLLVAIVIATIIALVLFFFSKSFRVDKTIEYIKIYSKYQELTSYSFKRGGNKRLGDMRILSAYNASHCGYQMLDYTSEDITKAILNSGARYLEFTVFNSEFGDRAIPVVSSGYRQGEWKMMLTDTPLEFIFNVIAKNAFSVNSKDGTGCPNPEDPIFIGLNLNTNTNLVCLDKIAKLITDYFRERLLESKYSYQSSDDIGDILMGQLLGKVVIFSSDGFQGSKLEELVNYCWDNPNKRAKHMMRRIHYSEFESPSFNSRELKNFNKKGLTIIVPHQEGDIFTENYNPQKALDYGCQFIAMNFQNVDKQMDTIITLFKNKAIILKPSRQELKN